VSERFPPFPEPVEFAPDPGDPDWTSPEIGREIFTRRPDWRRNSVHFNVVVRPDRPQYYWYVLLQRTAVVGGNMSFGRVTDSPTSRYRIHPPDTNILVEEDTPGDAAGRYVLTLLDVGYGLSGDDDLPRRYDVTDPGIGDYTED
jgi:hypothetical protein